MKIHTVLVLSVGLLASAASAQDERPGGAATAQQPPAFPARSELVIVDAVVVDRDGNAVAGLSRDDFVVKEDGEIQLVRSFEAVRAPRPRPPSGATSGAEPTRSTPRVRVSTNQASPGRSAGRSFVIVFDEVNLTSPLAERARTAVADFIEQGVGPGDRVTVVGTGSGAWWTARMDAGREEILAFLEGLRGRFIPGSSFLPMTDYEALRVHLYNDTTVGERVRRRFWQMGVDRYDEERVYEYYPGQNTPMVESRAMQVYDQARRRYLVTLGTIERLLDAMATTQGRKSMILVSQGFVHDPNLEESRTVLEASRRANVAIYFLDARGLVSGPTQLRAEFMQPLFERDTAFPTQELALEAEGSESLALNTGGFTIKNTNDLASGIQRIVRESAVYYLLGYRPTRAEPDGKFHEIRVEVQREGLEVRARKGYYALDVRTPSPAERDPEAPDPELQRALDSPFEITEIPARMTAFVFGEKEPGKADVLVAADVDVRGFAFEENDGRFTDVLDVVLIVTHRESGEYSVYDQKVTMELRPETRERVSREGYSLTRSFELVPGVHQAKLVVRDRRGARLGSVTHNIEVPELGGLRVSTPILSDTLQNTGGEQGPPRPAVVARRVFAPGSVLFCAFDVYGAARDPASGAPRVRSGYVLKRSDGTTQRWREPSPIAPGPSGEVSRLMGLRLEGAPPGDYELILSVVDDVSGETLKLREPLTIGTVKRPRARR